MGGVCCREARSGLDGSDASHVGGARMSEIGVDPSGVAAMNSGARKARARDTRLFTVPTLVRLIAAASS